MFIEIVWLDVYESRRKWWRKEIKYIQMCSHWFLQDKVWYTTSRFTIRNMMVKIDVRIAYICVYLNEIKFTTEEKRIQKLKLLFLFIARDEHEARTIGSEWKGKIRSKVIGMKIFRFAYSRKIVDWSFGCQFIRKMLALIRSPFKHFEHKSKFVSTLFRSKCFISKFVFCSAVGDARWGHGENCLAKLTLSFCVYYYYPFHSMA